jgi:SEC-C motif domain protein
MRRLAGNGPCPCGSGRRAKGCCGPLLAGNLATSPEALMRSRYVAYVVGDVGYLLATTAPDSPHAEPDARRWRAELAAYCERVEFLGLEVRASSEDGDHGRVSFFARLAVDGRDASFGEDSRFVRRGGRWLYLAGAPRPKEADDI